MPSWHEAAFNLVPGRPSPMKLPQLALLLVACTTLQVPAQPPGECRLALGMEEGRIPDTALSASSSYELKSTGPQNARVRQELNGGAWCPKAQISSEVREYLEVDLTKNHLVTWTETQGRFGNGQGQEYTEAYIVEYWRDSLQKWTVYKNTKGEKVLKGNTNTYLEVRQELELPFVSSRVRFIPYSEHPRTVCMRVEIYGCSWHQGILSYRAPKGDQEFGDLSYDGWSEDGLMVGGLGQLVDGIFGTEDFIQESRRQPTGNRWVGWMNESQETDELNIDFEFEGVRNFTSMHIHTTHFPSRDVQVFSSAMVVFSMDGVKYQSLPVKFVPLMEHPKQAAYNISIPLHDRLARYVRIKLQFSSRWILLSEVTFDSTPLSMNMSDEALDKYYLPPPDNEIDARPIPGGETTDARKEITPGTRPASQTQAYIGLITGVLAVVVLLLGCTVLLMVRRGRKKVALLHKHSALTASKPGVTINMKDLKMSTPIISTAKPAPRKSQYGHMGEESDSENSSVYHEPYKLLPPAKQEYGCLIKKEPLTSSKSAEYNSGLCRSLDFTNVNSFQEEVKFSSPSLYNLSPPPPPPPPPACRPPPYDSPAPPAPYSKTLSNNKLENYYAATDIVKTERREQHLTPGRITPYKLPEGSPEDRPALLEFSRHRLRVVEKLGEGAFGMIHLCETEGVPEYNGVTSYHKKQVLVKSLWRGCSDSVKKEFLRECGWLGSLRDPNLARVVGLCHQDEPYCVLQEYSELGDLPSFLQSTTEQQQEKPISYGCLIYIATQVASGMKYLESLELAHRDLAARNCLVGKNMQVRVSDHAMYCSQYETDYYLSDTKSRLPIRWMSWESLLLGKQSCKGDVWSFGVLLWEVLVLCGQRPFGEFTNEQVVENCSHWYQDDGLERLLGRPPACPREIYDLMTECWRRTDQDRPRFSEIHLFLQRKNLGYLP